MVMLILFKAPVQNSHFTLPYMYRFSVG